jgi:mannose-1-phosphate guanylyltransferase
LAAIARSLSQAAFSADLSQAYRWYLWPVLSVISSHQLRFLIAEQLEQIAAKPCNIVLEPVGRNTAPAACIAALIASRD